MQAVHQVFADLALVAIRTQNGHGVEIQIDNAKLAHDSTGYLVLLLETASVESLW